MIWQTISRKILQLWIRRKSWRKYLQGNPKKQIYKKGNKARKCRVRDYWETSKCLQRISKCPVARMKYEHIQSMMDISWWSASRNYKILPSWTFILVSSKPNPSFQGSCRNHPHQCSGDPKSRNHIIQVSSYSSFQQCYRHTILPHTLSDTQM